MDNEPNKYGGDKVQPEKAFVEPHKIEDSCLILSVTEF